MLGQCRAHRLAVGNLLGIDAGAVQDQRQKVPDAGVGVDDKAERRAGLGALRSASGVAAMLVDCAGFALIPEIQAPT